MKQNKLSRDARINRVGVGQVGVTYKLRIMVMV